MSTTPQGSTTNQDEFNFTATNPPTTIKEGAQDYIVIGDESDCRRNEAFDLPKSKKFKSVTSLTSNGSEPTVMSSNGNGNNPVVEAMEHTNGGTNCNGVCISFVIILLRDEKERFLREELMVYFRRNFCLKSSDDDSSQIIVVSVERFLGLTLTDICVEKESNCFTVLLSFSLHSLHRSPVTDDRKRREQKRKKNTRTQRHPSSVLFLFMENKLCPFYARKEKKSTDRQKEKERT